MAVLIAAPVLGATFTITGPGWLHMLTLPLVGGNMIKPKRILVAYCVIIDRSTLPAMVHLDGLFMFAGCPLGACCMEQLRSRTIMRLESQTAARAGVWIARTRKSPANNLT